MLIGIREFELVSEISRERYLRVFQELLLQPLIINRCLWMKAIREYLHLALLWGHGKPKPHSF